MKKRYTDFIEVSGNSSTFIAGWMMDTDICDEIKADYDSKFELAVYDKLRDYHRINNKKLDKDLMDKYLDKLKILFSRYKDMFPWCAKQLPKWSVMSPFNIQKYDPGHYYKHLHTEDAGPRKGKLIRNLTFLTYLNDIKDGGYTEFPYQKIKATPKKGLTLIWPAGWICPHIGHPAPEQSKYIITGWSSYHHRC
jgi:hypothetical protein